VYSKLIEIYIEIRRAVEDYLEKLCREQYTVILFGSRARGTIDRIVIGIYS